MPIFPDYLEKMSNRIEMQIGSRIPRRPLTPKVYYRNSLQTITIPVCKEVTLSSSPNGTGDLLIDDKLVIRINGNVLFEHDFRGSDANSLESIPPVNLTEALRPFFGQHVQMEIEYQDIHGVAEFAEPVYFTFDEWDSIYSNVYVMEDETYVFCYTTDTITFPEFTPGGAFFHGSKFECEGMVPIYWHSANAEDERRREVYYYSKSEQGPDGYETRGVAFYAFADPQPNTVPVYGSRRPINGKDDLWVYLLHFETSPPIHYEGLGIQFYVPRVG